MSNGNEAPSGGGSPTLAGPAETTPQEIARPACVILFGAGASYGSGDNTVTPYPPPLGDGLFQKLSEDFPLTWGDVTLGMRAAFVNKGGFEEAMQMIIDKPQDQGRPYPEYLVDMAKYFTRFEIRDRSNYYVRLINFLIGSGLDRRTTFASLNYDCLLEQAIGSRGRVVTYLFHRSAPSSPLDVIKIHGSCNFVIRYNQFAVHNLTLITPYGINAIEADFEVVPLQPKEALAQLDSGHDMHPFIAAYAPGKHNLGHNGAGRNAKGCWLDRVCQAKVLVMIGVNPNPLDRHIWETICDATKARVLFIGGTDGLHYAAFVQTMADRFEHLERRS